MPRDIRVRGLPATFSDFKPLPFSNWMPPKKLALRSLLNLAIDEPPFVFIRMLPFVPLAMTLLTIAFVPIRLGTVRLPVIVSPEMETDSVSAAELMSSNAAAVTRSSIFVPLEKEEAVVPSCPRTTVRSLLLIAVTLTTSIVGELVSVSIVRYM